MADNRETVHTYDFLFQDPVTARRVEAEGKGKDPKAAEPEALEEARKEVPDMHNYVLVSCVERQ